MLGVRKLLSLLTGPLISGITAKIGASMQKNDKNQVSQREAVVERGGGKMEKMRH